MQAVLRTARLRALRATAHRDLSSAANVSASSSPVSSSRASSIPLSNIEAHWCKMTHEEQIDAQDMLVNLQKRDWKELSLNEKKAAYFVAFGPHGARAPVNPPGELVKVFFGTAALVALSGAAYYIIRLNAPPPPKTLTKEWEVAANQRARDMKLNPITGISSEGYTGKGFVVHK